MSDGPDLPSKIESWLAKQGYPLEMRTAQVFREVGFDVQHGHYFLDVDGSKYRELDLLAEIQHDVAGRWIFGEVQVECKRGGSKPWIVFKGRDTSALPEAEILWSAASPAAQQLALRIVKDEATERLKDPLSCLLPQLPWDCRAFGVVEALKDRGNSPDPAYIAVQKLIKSMEDVRRNPRTEYASFWFSFPLVVIKGPLFSASLNESGDIDIVEIESAGLSTDIPVGPKSLPCEVSIVRLGSVRLFAQRYAEIMSHICDRWATAIEEILPDRDAAG